MSIVQKGRSVSAEPRQLGVPAQKDAGYTRHASRRQRRSPDPHRLIDSDGLADAFDLCFTHGLKVKQGARLLVHMGADQHVPRPCQRFDPRR